jgi:hypothetical protein
LEKRTIPKKWYFRMILNKTLFSFIRIINVYELHLP